MRFLFRLRVYALIAAGFVYEDLRLTWAEWYACPRRGHDERWLDHESGYCGRCNRRLGKWPWFDTGDRRPHPVKDDTNARRV